MSAGFTPGPWRADFLQPPTIVDTSGQEVVDMPLWQPAFQDERDANARLIAAAPELYEALQEAVCLVPASQKTALAKFNAALAKVQS